MRKLLFIIALFACTSINTFAFERNESLSVNEKETHFPISKDSLPDNHYVSLLLGLGPIVSLNNNSNIEFETFKSWEFTFGLAYNYRPNKALQTYSAGLACTWRHFSPSPKGMLVKDDSGLIHLDNFPAGVDHAHSGLSVFSVSIPLMFTQDFGKKSHVSLSLGPVVNINAASLENNYNIGDNHYDITTDHIGCRPITVDLMGILTVYGVGIYCKYSPMSLMKSKTGMDFKTLSIGLCL